MTDAIIFSKNRAMQLDLLLISIEKYAPFLRCIVIMKHTNEKHNSSYKVLALDYPDVVFIEEADTKRQVIDEITSERMMFLCDDDVFFKEAPEIEISEFETFSMRLGDNVRNTTYFNYNLSLDGNVFNSKTIIDFLSKLPEEAFRNPNKLEAALVGRYNDQLSMKYDYQCLVGIPHNRVSDTSGCHFSGKYDENRLCEMFLGGDRVHIDPVCFQEISDIHKEIDFIIG